jgi:hypothetical protein
MTDPNILAALAALLMLLAFYSPLQFAPAVVTGLDDLVPKKPERKPWEDLLMFKKGGGDAPAPDPNIGKAALKNAQLGEEWLTFAKDQFDIANDRQIELDDLTKRIGESQLATQDKMNQWADEDRSNAMADREWALGERDKFSNLANDLRGRADDIAGQASIYRGWAQEDREFAKDLREDYDKFRPVNDKIISDSMNWDSKSRLADRAAEARADVMTAGAAAQQQNERAMASMGINPNSGRFQSGTRLAALQTGLTAAGAQNAARSQARNEAVGMRQNAAALGQNVLGQSQNATQIANSTASLANVTDGLSLDATKTGMAADGMSMGAAGFAAGQYNAGLGAAGLGVNSGAAAQSGALANHGSFVGNTGIVGQGYQGAMSGYSNQANILNQQHQNQLQAWSANQQAAGAGIGGLFGAIGSGIGAFAALSDKDAKTKKKPVKGALEAVKGLPVEAWEYTKEGQKREVAADIIPADDKRHIGTYAQDFARETGIGDGKSIPLQDAIGITMKAVQELDDKVERVAAKGGKRTKQRAAA